MELFGYSVPLEAIILALVAAVLIGIALLRWVGISNLMVFGQILLLAGFLIVVVCATAFLTGQWIVEWVSHLHITPKGLTLVSAIVAGLCAISAVYEFLLSNSNNRKRRAENLTKGFVVSLVIFVILTVISATPA